MAIKLYVGNLAYTADEDDLRTLFEQAGSVESVKVITDRYTNQPRGFAFVEMGSKAEAVKAIQMFNGYSLKDRNLVVNEARPPEDRGGFRSGGPRRGGRQRH